MNNILHVFLVSSLIALSACGGQTHLNTSGAQPNLAISAQTPPPATSTLQGPAAQARPPQSTATPTKSTNSPTKSPITAVTAVTAVKKPTALASIKPATPPTPVKAPQLSAGQVLLAKAVERFNTLNSFKISVEGFETSTEKGPTRLSFQMSSLNGLNKIEVLKHTHSLYVGVKMGYQSGTGQISVRPSGALGFVKIDTKMNDERLLTARGYRLDQIDAFAISQRLLKGNHQPKILGKTQINGRNIAILEYTQANDFDASITRELLGIDMENNFLRIHEMYEGSKLVFSLKLDNVELNAPVTAKDLEV